MENKTPRYVDINNFIRLCNLWIGQLQSPKDAGDLNGVQTCLDVLLDEPVADVAEVIHARWDIDVGMNYNKERICPVCKKCIESNFWNYCPNCGAKMDGEIK